MPSLNKKNISVFLIGFFLIWAILKFFLPIVLPFLLGATLALSAEPMVKRLSAKVPRPVAAAIGVATTLLLLVFLLFLLTAILFRELRLLANVVPDLAETAQNGLLSLENFLLSLTERAPDSVRPLLFQSVTNLFSNSSTLVSQFLQKLPSLATSFLGWIPGSAIALGTGILSSFMLSARFPKIQNRIRGLCSTDLICRYLPLFKQARVALTGWLKAQLKLIGLCFLIICGGLLLLRIPYGPLWALLIAFVDAIPILGTGTVLLPWSLICLLQGQTPRAIGLISVYIVALLSRSIFEPRLVGKQLGLDPLVTLVALYTGFQFWGIGGMLLSPMICVVLFQFIRSKQ